MKRSEAVLRISAKLQKQLHLMKSQIMLDNPKMLCDNLALRVMTEIEEIGMLPPPNHSDAVTDRLIYAYYNHEGVKGNDECEPILESLWENEECWDIS